MGAVAVQILHLLIQHLLNADIAVSEIRMIVIVLRVGLLPAPHRVSAQQNPLETLCIAVSAPPVGMNFFFTKKWVGGRSFLREASAKQGLQFCPP